MKKKVKVIQGKEVTEYIPENDEDLQELDRMMIEGRVDPTDYFHGEKPAIHKKKNLVK